MKVLIQGMKNGDYVKVWDNVTFITFESNGWFRLHRRTGDSFTLNPELYKVLSIS